MKRISWLVGLMMVGLLTFCSDKDQIVNLPPVANFTVSDAINRFSLDGSTSTDPEGHILTYTWSTASNKILITDPANAKPFFNIPDGQEAFDVDVTLKVSDGKNTTSSSKTISVPPLTPVRVFGLGKNLQKEVSNNVAYEWYLDQGNTGPASSVNCGPTSVTMSIKWNNPNFTGTPQNARDTYPEGGGWWYTSDILNYLNDFSVPHSVVSLTAMDVIKNQIDNGNILILCLDMYYVEYQTDAVFHFDKFYQTQNTGWGHFIVAKGYKEVDGQTFLEMYDPNTFGREYSNSSLLGKDRYYKAEDIDRATNVWWDYAIVVSKDGSTGGRFSVNPNNIVHMRGR